MARNPRSGSAVPTSPQNPPTNLASLWSTEYERFRASRQRINEAGQWRRREVPPRVPWSDPGPFQVMLPHATTMGQAVVSFLGRKRPAVRRDPLGSDPRAERIAERIEAWLQPAIEDELKSGGENLFDAALAFLVNDGEFACIVQPAVSHWDNMLAYTVNEGGAERISPHFERDAKGRAKDDEFFAGLKPSAFKPDKKMSAKAHADYMKDAKARALPFVVRLLPAEMVIPIGLDPQTGRVDGLLIRSDRTAISLHRDGFQFVAKGPGIVAAGLGSSMTSNSGFYGGQSPLSGAGTLFSLYELWTGSTDDQPCQVIYQVGNATGTDAYTTMFRGNPDAVINLEAEYGLTRVPGGYFWGCHHGSETDPNKKGYPFIYVFLSLLRGANQMLSSQVAHTYLTAFGGWLSRLTAEDAQTWIELGKPTDIEIKPGMVNFVTGDLSPAVHPGTGKDVDAFLQFALGILKDQGPQGAAPSPDQSGFAQGVSVASSDASFSQITNGALMCLEVICECLLEQIAAISDKTGAPVPVYAHVDPKTGRRQDHVELSADDIQGSFAVDVILPQTKFTNLALMQAGSVWVEQGLLPKRVWLEEMAGFPNADTVEDQLWVEQQLASPEGQQYVLQLAAKYSGEKDLQQLQKLQTQGKATPGGTPTAALPPRPPMPAAGQPGPPGTGNPAQSALAGIVGGTQMVAPQARLIQATGQPAEVSS